MNCKKCEAELEEGMKFCPNCGAAQDEAVVDEIISEVLNEETPVEEAPAREITPAKPGLSAGKIALLVVLGIAAIAVVIALLVGGAGGKTPPETTAPSEPAATGEAAAATVPADGNPDDVTCKGSYAASDEEIVAAADSVVATMDGVDQPNPELTNAQLQVYYWMSVYDFLNQYGSYASMFGLDYTQPMETQLSIEGTTTWQQYFLESALTTWTNYQAMCLAAGESGYTLDEEYRLYLEELPASLEESALSMGYESAEAMIQRDMGPGATLEGYLNYLQTYYVGYNFYLDCLALAEFTDEEVEAYFDEHAAEYLENGMEKTDEVYVDVRHILIAPEGGTTAEDGSTVYSDAEWATAEAKANEILNEWLTKNPTEDGFSVLAETYSVDGGSASNGGLYTGVYIGQMVEPFENWCFDASRQVGDYGIVKTNYGYHIMYFVGSELAWRLTAEQDMMAERGNELVQNFVKAYPAEINYSEIKLGNVDLAAAG